VTRFLHTPRQRGWAAALLLVCAGPRAALAQSGGTGALLDALSITVQVDSAPIARGSLRFRQFRTGTDVELVASGIVVRRGLRVTAELRTDSALVLRRYVAESRDSAGVLVDRVQVTSAGGRVTLERVTPVRRMVREFVAQRELVILDTASAVPFVALAGLSQRQATLAFLDVRRGTIATGTTTLGQAVDLSVAEVMVTGTPVSVAGLPSPLSWWRDTRGRLLRVAWGAGSRVLRDDPPA
jgi:hypothetical protein